MRSIKTILETFSEFTAKDFQNAQQLFVSQAEGDKQAALNLAFLSLGISLEQLENIPTAELKKKFLTYHKLLAEFEFHPNRYESDKKALADQLIILTKIAYEYLVQAELVQSDNSNYGIHSLGLHDIFVRTPYRKVRTIQHLDQTLIANDVKKDGVEPGFEGWLLEDLLNALEKKFPNTDERLQYIAKHGLKPSTLYSSLIAAHHVLPRYMIKLDYRSTNNGMVIPEEKDLERSQTIQRLKKISPRLGRLALKIYRFYKRRSVIKVNANAVREVLANDYARLFGMEVQDQRILLSHYKDGSLKVMLKSKILANAWNIGTNQDFQGEQSALHGSKNGKQQNYLAIKTPLELGGVAYVSDSSIQDLGRYLPLMLVQDDYDAIGSRGQNKMRDKHRLLGIDFGHAFAAKNKIIKILDHAFGFNRSQYKNFSIFYDSPRHASPRRSHVQGLLILAKLQGEPLDKAILKAHGEEFYQFINNLNAGDDKKIFKDYLNVFKTKLASESNPSQQSGLKAIIDEINKAKKYALSARKEFVKKFKYYLDMPPSMIDLVENLEKLHACTQGNATLLSNTPGPKVGNIVLLNHIKLLNPAKRLKWQFDHTHTEHRLTLPKFSKTDKFYQEVVKKLETAGINPELRRGKLTLKIKKNQLDSLAKLLDEEQLKRDYLAEDYAIQCAFAIKQLATDNGKFDVEITKDKLINQRLYKLKLRTEDPILAAVFQIASDNTLELNLNAQELALYYRNLQKYLPFWPTLNELKQQVEKLNGSLTSTDAHLNLEFDFANQQVFLNLNCVDTPLAKQLQAEYLQDFRKGEKSFCLPFECLKQGTTQLKELYNVKERELTFFGDSGMPSPIRSPKGLRAKYHRTPTRHQPISPTKRTNINLAFANTSASELVPFEQDGWLRIEYPADRILALFFIECFRDCPKDEQGNVLIPLSEQQHDATDTASKIAYFKLAHKLLVSLNALASYYEFKRKVGLASFFKAKPGNHLTSTTIGYLMRARLNAFNTTVTNLSEVIEHLDSLKQELIQRQDCINRKPVHSFKEAPLLADCISHINQLLNRPDGSLVLQAIEPVPMLS